MGFEPTHHSIKNYCLTTWLRLYVYNITLNFGDSRSRTHTNDFEDHCSAIKLYLITTNTSRGGIEPPAYG